MRHSAAAKSLSFDEGTEAGVPTDVSARTEYWDNYYATKKPSPPSAFAEFCLGRHVLPGDAVMEAGCGCGRDSLFFASRGCIVHAVDLSQTAIGKLQDATAEHADIAFYHADFTRLGDDIPEVDVVYSRWTIHAIDRHGQGRFLAWASRRLKPGGRLLIECRSVNDPLYGVGEEVGPDEYFTTHYRRFLRKKELEQEISSLGFSISYAEEATGWSPSPIDDPVLIRIVAQRD